MIRDYEYEIQANWEQTGKASSILNYAHESAAAYLDAFDSSRIGKLGASTDEEQDLLRGMLIFSAAGLDGMTKELIRNAVPSLISQDNDQVRKGLERFVAREISKGLEDTSDHGVKFLSRLFTAENHQQRAIEEYVYELTGSSLQSGDELVKAVSALGQDPAQLGIIARDLQSIFAIRNVIIHELDINFGAPRRNRNQRGRNDMIDYSNSLLGAGENILIAVDCELAA